MRIICPTCASHYEVDQDKIGAAGQLVRCANCREVWLALPGPDPKPEIPTAEAVQRAGRDVNAFAAAVFAQAHAAASSERQASPDGLIDFEAAKARLRRRGDAKVAGGALRGGTAGLLSLGAACAVLLAGAVGLRGPLVNKVPALGPAYAALGLPVNTQGLALRDVRSVMVAEGNKTVLSLEGEIANLRDGPTAVPNLTVVVRDDAQTPLYTFTTPAPKAELGKGETVAFRSRLAAPPTDGRDVRVSFADAGQGTVIPR